MFVPSTHPRRRISSKKDRVAGSSSSDSPAKSTTTEATRAGCANASRGATRPAANAPSSLLLIAISSSIAKGHSYADRGLLVVVVDQGLAVAGGELDVELQRPERIQYWRCPVELHEPPVGMQVAAHERRGHVAARGLIASNEVAATQVPLDVRVVVAALRDPVPDAREHREPVPLPATLHVLPVPAAVFGFALPVGFMHQAQVDELEAITLVAGAQGQDCLGLVVRIPDGTRVAVVERLPVHFLRVAEPQAHAVDADMAESPGDAGLLECLARNQLGLEARLEFELILVQIREWCEAGPRAARLIVRAVRPAQNYVVRPVSQDVCQVPYPAVLHAELPGPGQVRRTRGRVDGPCGGRLRCPRELVIAREPLVDVLELRAPRKPVLRAARRGQEPRTQRHEHCETAAHQPNAIYAPASAAVSATVNSRRGPPSRASLRSSPTGRGARARRSRSRPPFAATRCSAAEESNWRDSGRRVSETIARAAGACGALSLVDSSFTVLVTWSRSLPPAASRERSSARQLRRSAAISVASW